MLTHGPGTAPGAHPVIAVALAALIAVAGCARLADTARDAGPASREMPAPEPAAAPQSPAGTVPQALAHARAPVRALSLRADCSVRDPNGYAERIALRVSNGLVDYLDASVDVPRSGSCSFRLDQFRQTKRTPFVELLALREGSRCAVRIWTQGDRVTVAPTDCQEMCASPRAFESVWPIGLSARTGSCL